MVCPIGAAGSATRTHADWLLHEIIEHVFEAHFPGEFEIVRADRIDEPGMIDAQIINHLLEDDLVIADMTELNANAFYEMGIRHMIEKPIIHMFKEGTEIPFDVKLFRAIPFSYDSPLALKSARTALCSAARTVMDHDHKPDNPIIRARGVVQLEASATPALQLLHQELGSLSSRVSEMEKSLPVRVNPKRHQAKFTFQSQSYEGFLAKMEHEKDSSLLTFSFRAQISSTQAAEIDSQIEKGNVHPNAIGYGWDGNSLKIEIGEKCSENEFRAVLDRIDRLL